MRQVGGREETAMHMRGPPAKVARKDPREIKSQRSRNVAATPPRPGASYNAFLFSAITRTIRGWGVRAQVS